MNKIKYRKSTLRRRQCPNPQCVNIRCQKFSQGIINHSVALNPTLSLEFLRYDRHVEMAAPIFSALMPGMEVALIFYEQFCRMKASLQFFPNQCRAVLGHGRTSLNGFTVTLA